MLLTITNTRPPATDLSYLLHKRPERVQTFAVPFGRAHVFYPEASEERCTAALLLDIDALGLARGRRHKAADSEALEQYVNDRPYVASSFLSVAIGSVYRSALAGRSGERAELVTQPLPLSARISVLPCRGGEDFLRSLFEPLGYSVIAQGHDLDEKFPEWGRSPYFAVELQATVTLRDLLTHLYVLVPVLDDNKHYWVGDDEVEKLLRHGAGWLASHPQREAIARRYLKHRQSLASEALSRLADEDNLDPDSIAEERSFDEALLEKRINLNEQRLRTVLAVLRSSDAKSVIDLGCGEGGLLRLLLEDKSFERITGMDASWRALEIAQTRLALDRLPSQQRDRIELIHGALTYRDKRLAGYDAAAVLEVVEHLDPARVAAFERVVFEVARPGVVVLTTPNFEYNVKFDTLPAGRLRHKDHRFEWNREEFQCWAFSVANRFDYAVRFAPVGPDDDTLGPPTQVGVFTRFAGPNS